MRADRSLIPGLGAAASLVAAVACAFFVTAGVVAFNSWPQVASTSDARAVVVAGDRPHARAIVAPTPRTSRTTTHTASAPARTTTIRPAIVAGTVKPARTRTILTVEPKVRPTPISSTPARPHDNPTTTPTLAPDTLAGTTQVTATNVGGLVNGLTNGLASTVAPINPALADTVTNLGDSVSGAVISIGNNLAELLLGLTPSQ